MKPNRSRITNDESKHDLSIPHYVHIYFKTEDLTKTCLYPSSYPLSSRRCVYEYCIQIVRL